MLKIKAFFARILQDLKKYKWLLIGIGVYYVIVKERFHAFCPLVIITGFPCPGCGMTRAVMYMLQGQVERSWNLNPLAIGWILLAIWFVFRRYWCGKKVNELKILFAIIIVLMVLSYFYRMITIFPDYPPMTYTRNNILSRYVPFYEKLLRSMQLI